MYRLHNLGIDAKIDWLVKKGKLINRSSRYIIPST